MRQQWRLQEATFWWRCWFLVVGGGEDGVLQHRRMKEEVRRGSKGEEMVAWVELTEEGGRTVVEALISVVPIVLRRLEWIGGHRGEVGAFACDRAERETM
jgi:hypothetical protein